MVVFALGILLASCGGRKTADKNQTAVMESLDSLERQAEVEKQLEENQEDIKALWDEEIGEDKAIDKYALAGEYVYLSSEDGKEGMLLTFYLDGRNENNFDGIAIKENERMAFYGKADGSSSMTMRVELYPSLKLRKLCRCLTTPLPHPWKRC